MKGNVFGFEARDVRITLDFFRAGVRDKYLGSSLGSVWGIANPLLMLAIFTFVFGYVYKIRLPGAETTLAFAIWLISGYGPWIAVTESIMASATSITSAAGIIKNLAIKAEVLPISSALTGVLPLLVSLVFLLILLIADGNIPSWHVVFLPVIIVLQFLFVTAVGFLLAAITVFFRDLAYALPNLLTVVLFASPIFYPLESMPRVLQAVSRFNPVYVLAESYRAVLLQHKIPDLLGLAYLMVLAAALGFLSLRVFRRLKGYFEAAL